MTKSNLIPQIISIVAVTRDFKISVKKEVREYLNALRAPLYLKDGKELLLAPIKSPKAQVAEFARHRMTIPRELAAKLTLDQDGHVALIRRANAVAIKKFVIEEVDGLEANVEDVETAGAMTRRATVIPPPEELWPRLLERAAQMKLKHDVRAFVRGRESLECWRARQLLDIEEPGDADLRKALIDERLASQDADGSWRQETVRTARNLRELTELGVSPRRKATKAGAQWLLDRAESGVNPGMWLLNDELTRLQEQRNRQDRRFRDRKPKEESLVREGHPLITRACGARILWPNGIVLEAMLKMGHEKLPRVQRAIRSTLLVPWCECAAQGGADLFRKGPPPREDQVERALDRRVEDSEATVIGGSQYAARARRRLLHVDITGNRMLVRTGHRVVAGKDVYSLHLGLGNEGGCGLISIRGLVHSTDARVKRMVRCMLLGQISQSPSDGPANPMGIFNMWRSAYAIRLDTLASIDDELVRTVLLRYVPWIVTSQNRDGSWGQNEYKDATTLCVLRGLLRAKSCLPPGLHA